MEKPKLIQRFAERFSVDPNKLFDTLKATAFKQRDGSAPTNEQMMALLVVADQYGLNPFTKEIFAFPDKQAGIYSSGRCRWMVSHHQSTRPV